MEGLERLQAEVLEINNYNISAIFDYLKTRNDLHEKFNNEEILLKTNKNLIYESNDNGGNVSISNITFSTDKGLFLKPSKDLLENEDYSTLIIWSIEA